MNWREGREQYGKIRSGQFWKKRDTGRTMRVQNRASSNCWRVLFLGGGETHTLKERDIYKYYEMIL